MMGFMHYLETHEWDEKLEVNFCVAVFSTIGHAIDVMSLAGFDTGRTLCNRSCGGTQRRWHGGRPLVPLVPCSSFAATTPRETLSVSFLTRLPLRIAAAVERLRVSSLLKWWTYSTVISVHSAHAHQWAEMKIS